LVLCWWDICDDDDDDNDEVEEEGLQTGMKDVMTTFGGRIMSCHLECVIVIVVVVVTL
jgi:hypothetical protein